jgi:D-lactate dehydrogenase
MKILAYGVGPVEINAFNEFSEKYGHEVTRLSENFGPDTAHLAKGYGGISTFGTCNVNRQALEEVSKYGIKYIAQRTSGYNNIDVEAAKELGFKVSNVPAYSPNSVSEFTIGLALSLTRNIPRVVKRMDMQNFGLAGLLGRELRKMTIGVIGTGRIGLMVIKAFAGLGCKIIANDVYQNEETKKYATYVSLDELYANADLITLHTPLFDSTAHMINEAAIAKMKDNVIIINAARGGLIDTEALLKGIKSGKISKVAMDSYENELEYFHHDYTNKLVQDDTLARLLQLPNVIVTPHCAFFTDEAVSNMVEIALSNLREFELKGACKDELK